MNLLELLFYEKWYYQLGTKIAFSNDAIFNYLLRWNVISYYLYLFKKYFWHKLLQKYCVYSIKKLWKRYLLHLVPCNVFQTERDLGIHNVCLLTMLFVLVSLSMKILHALLIYYHICYCHFSRNSVHLLHFFKTNKTLFSWKRLPYRVQMFRLWLEDKRAVFDLKIG